MAISRNEPTEKLGISLNLELAFSRGSNAQVLWDEWQSRQAHLASSTIDSFKAFAVKLDQVVLNHGSRQDVGLTDKSGNKMVDRLV